MAEGPVEPKNVLFVYGAHDLEPVRKVTPESMARLTGVDHPEHNKTYGSFEDGTARRMVAIPGTDHLAVILAEPTAREVIAWCREVWPIGQDSDVSDPRRAWLGITFAGSLALTGALAFVFLPWLPVLDAQPSGGAWPLRLAIIAGAHLLAVILLTVGNPLGFIPMWGAPYLLTFYMLAGFLMLFYGVATGAADWKLFWPDAWRTCGMALALGFVFYLLFGSASDAGWYHLTLPPHRGQFWLWSIVPLSVYCIGLDALVKKGGTVQQLLMSWGAVILMLAICVLSVQKHVMPFYVFLVLPVLAILTLTLELPAIAMSRKTNNYFLSGLYRAVILAAVNAACWPTL